MWIRHKKTKATKDNSDLDKVSSDKITSRQTNTTSNNTNSNALTSNFNFSHVPMLSSSTPIQAKLTIGQPNDKYEQQADQMAEQVMQVPNSQTNNTQQGVDDQTKSLSKQISPLVQRASDMPRKDDEDESKMLQASSAGGPSPAAAGNSSTVASGITTMQGGGQALTPATKAFMEPRFGHDFSRVRIHADSNAAKISQQINAKAFTVGQNVAFAAGQYQPNTSNGRQLLAHELTHTIQQKNWQAPNRDYNSVVQRVSSGYGEFKNPTYSDVSSGGKKVGVDIKLEFHPDKSKVDAKKIGLTQSVKSQLGGTDISLNPTRAEQRVKSGAGEGRRIDRLSTRNNPIYGSGASAPGDKLGDTALASTAQHGWHYFDAGGTEKTQEAFLKDTPTLPGRGNNSSQVFETAALGLEGKQKDTYMGSVEWGWQVDGTGSFSKKTFKIISNDIPSKGFMAAAAQWNSSTARGTIKVTGNPTDVYKWSSGFVKDYTIAKDSEVILQSDGGSIQNNLHYNKVKITTTGNNGYILTTDMKDQGDGAATIDLPTQWPGTMNTAGTLREGKGTSTAVLADLPASTRVKVMDDSSAWHLVEVDTSQPNVILNQLSTSKRDVAKMLRGYVSKELINK